MFWAIFIRITKRMWHLVNSNEVFQPRNCLLHSQLSPAPFSRCISPTETRRRGAQALGETPSGHLIFRSKQHWGKDSAGCASPTPPVASCTVAPSCAPRD